jgi:hypothetical protein
MIRKPTQWNAEYGIARMHWKDLEDVASLKEHILILRGGKAATIPFIEKNFPGKPPELKFLKINKVSGLLETAPQDVGQWAQVFHAGHLVLAMAKERKKSARLVAVGPVRPGPIGHGPREEFEVPYGGEPWAKPGLVIDRKTLLPFTSDYDLGAVIDAADYRFGKTFLAVIPGGNKGPGGKTKAFATEPVWNPPKPLDVNWSNPFVDAIINALNAKMEAHHFPNGPGLPRFNPRFLHGAVSNFSGNPALGDEKLVVFYPGGRVEEIPGSSPETARAELDEILRSTPAALGASPK